MAVIGKETGVRSFSMLDIENKVNNRPKIKGLDFLIALLLAMIFAGAVYMGLRMVPEIVFFQRDVWFDADTSRVFNNMSKRDSSNERSNVHPLFTLINYPAVFLLKKVFSVDSIIAVKIVMAFVAFIWMFLMFILFRSIGCLRLDSVLLSLLAGVSAASMFYFVVPETCGSGSVTILMALIFAIWSQWKTFSSAWYVGINVITMSMTSTNWMAGIFATLVNLPLKKAVQNIVYALAVTTALWSVQKYIFVTSKFFMDIAEVGFFIFFAGPGTPLDATRAFFYHTLVMPTIYLVEETGRPALPGMYTHLSPPGSASVYGLFAVILWSFLLICGIWTLFTMKDQIKFRLVLGSAFICQLLLHNFYAPETFLYSLHFIVLLVPIVALTFLTKMRTLVLLVTFLLIPCVVINNVIQFKKAVSYFKDQSQFVIRKVHPPR